MEYKLKEDEMLLKVRKDNFGFLTGLNKDGSVPKAFESWKNGWYHNATEIETQIIKEYPREGWEIIDWRGGTSQTWVIVKHPVGFFLEIRMDNFMNDVLPFVAEGKKITGKWKWVKNYIERG